MKIICIGRNYSEHAKEMGAETPKEPVFFLKPDTAKLSDKIPFYYPNFTKELHYEVELVLKINRVGKNISPKFAHKYYNEIGVGIDFTARDLQRECKQKGLPWEKAKAFDYSAPVSKYFISVDSFENKEDIRFSLLKNGELVQQGSSADMIFSFEEIVAYVSQFITLKMGDLIFTGTPSGVGEVAIGDTLEAFMNGNKMLDLKVK